MLRLAAAFGCLARRCRRVSASENGSAVVEFVTLGVLLLVPVVYLVLVLGQLQGAAFAVEGASREAARVLASAEDEDRGAQAAAVVVALALDDQGLDRPGDPAPLVTVVCEAQPCLTPEASVRVRVQLDVVLPGVPAFVDGVLPTRVPVRAEGMAVVDRYAGVVLP